MGVTIKYMGRFGNNLFQYVFARTLAEKFRLNIETPWPYGNILPLSRMKIPVYSEPKMRESVVVSDVKKWQKEGQKSNLLADNYCNKDVVLRGYFQAPEYYNRNKVKTMFDLGRHEHRSPRSVVIHLRLGDYFQPILRTAIDPVWYVKCLKMCGNVDDVHIIAQSPDDYGKLDVPYKDESWKYIKSFPIKGKWHYPNLKESFDLIRSFPIIISSNSTFCWWAAILSGATRIFGFSPWYRYKKRTRALRLAYHKAFTPAHGKWVD
jgi:hypothetical protein